MSRKSPTRGVLLIAYALQLWLAIQALGQSSGAAGEFRSALAGQVQLLEKENAAAFRGVDGWLFLAAEFRFLSATRFWGTEAVQVSRSPRPEWADPIPAIVDFDKQLKDRGIQLLLVPIPSKAEIYLDKILPEVRISGSDIAPLTGLFYNELRSQGVDVLDLAPLFLAYRAKEPEALFCKTDTHWSGVGCVLAAQAIAEKVRAKVPELPPRSDYTSDWVNIAIEGDLSGLLSAKIPKPGPENVRIRNVATKTTGSGVVPDPSSPVLLLGDSFTLVFHDFYATNAGLLDQLAVELGFASDVIGTRGSGATPVRISLFRRGAKDPDYLAKKKIVIWCFAAREFTEAAQGWQKLPVAK
jgi:SGNH hydrolase-like domain, acetyltransferase AlgX